MNSAPSEVRRRPKRSVALRAWPGDRMHGIRSAILPGPPVTPQPGEAFAVHRPRIAARGHAAKGLKAQAVRASAVIVTALTLASCLAGDPAPTTTPATPSATDSALITLHFNERPPYLIATEDGVRGLTGDPTTLIFEKSGIPFQWKQTPSKRQIYLLQQNSGRDCLVGWFKNAEREQFARFTLPVYQDEPQFALVRADNSAIASGHTVAEMFAQPATHPPGKRRLFLRRLPG